MNIAMALAAGLMAASSVAFAADNNGGKNQNDTQRDQQITGSINTEGRPVSPAFREFCSTNPAARVLALRRTQNRES